MPEPEDADGEAYGQDTSSAMVVQMLQRGADQQICYLNAKRLPRSGAGS